MLYVWKVLIMGYFNIIKHRRLAAELTQKELAEKLKCSVMTVSASERPYKETKQLPSETYLEKVAQFFGTSKSDKIDLARRLLTERALISLPPVVAEQFRRSLSQRAVAHSGSMPVAFRNAVNKDWIATGKESLRDFSATDVAAIINGTRLLSRDEVILLANNLGQNGDSYLFIALYLTNSMLILSQHLGNFFNAGFGNRLNAMPDKDLRMFADIFMFALKQYEMNYKYKIVHEK
jgi:transcriptional regulator with XRE-family HTH domain